MNRLTIVLCAVLLTLAGWLLGDMRGYARGVAAGKLQCQAAHDSQAVGELTELITANKTLAAEANQASSRLRLAAAERQKAEQKFLKGFDDALRKTSVDRAGCVFDAGVMQQLNEAKQRAAAAAAGVPGRADAAVPSAGGASGGQR